MRAAEFITEGEKYQPPALSVGDKILKGKFKNSPAEIKGFTKDKHNQPVLKTNKGDVLLFKPRISKLMKEGVGSTTTLDQLYGGDFPDRDETFWDYVSNSELDNPLQVQTLQRHLVKIMLLSQYRAEDIEDITDMLDDEQQEIVDSYVNDPALSSKVIVVADNRIIDGNHRALAAAIKGVPINYVDLSELDDEVVDEGIKSKAAAAALAATLGGGAAADTTDWSVMQRYLKDRDVAAQQTAKAKTPAASKSNLDYILKDLRTQGDKLANARHSPQKKAAQAYQPVTDSNLETVLHTVAANTGMRGHELAAFMSQCAHESANFSSMHEYSSGKSYEGRRDLGNIYRGDGERFKGRGFIQITGRENYRKAGEALNLPLEQNPELASKPMIAAKIALWYWKTRVRPNVDNFSDTRQVTKPINPNMNGLADRHDKFKSYLAALGLRK